eukprot:gnl/TRDRNA2_/TRDRNA2_66352_c1_seq1.p1 gnl/TRDRNA2_/TRDRNA2_66352_c1~~gnl/TRDRNA2_/TRDRNA2_66352_c1_seq1.p1  ORF type:complete len:245 (+),score=69.31 gnl/TRDRNA2_/TRDRNA2_66352_c1_seq1:430-1164(+)
MEVVHIDSRKELLRKLATTDPEVMHELIRSIDTNKMMEMMARRTIDDIATMMEDGDVGLEEDDDDDETGTAVPPQTTATSYNELAQQDSREESQAADGGNDAKGIVDASGAASSGSKAEAGARSDAAAREGSVETRTPGIEADSARIQALSERLATQLKTGDKQGVTDYLMTTSVQDLMAVTEYFEVRYTKAEQKQMDKDFQKLIPGKEFAKLLRQRAELRDYVQLVMKRELDKKIASMKRKKA